MSLDLQPEDTSNSDTSTTATNTTLLLELIRLHKRTNLLLAAINVQLGKNGTAGPTSLAEVLDQENNEEI